LNRKPHHLRRVGLLAALIQLFAIAAPVMAEPLDEAVAIDLRAQPLGDALRELAKQSGLQLLFDPVLVEGRQASAVNGKLAPRKALRRLLRGTKLEVHEENPGVLVIRPRATESASVTSGTRPDPVPVSAGPAETADGFAPEEVIVTAQKREEKLQDVPIAISAISGEQITTRGIDNILDLKSLAPNLTVGKYPNSNVISQVAIRGGVTVNGALYFEPSVGMYLDGVYLGKAVGSVFDVVDLERVEVLRGPQGTLYGRNTMAGAVNFITRKPTGEFGGSTSVELGNYGGHIEKVSLDLPSFGIASLSLAARKEDRDGLVKLTGGGELDSRDKLGARVALALDFADNFVADYRFDYTKVDQASQAGQLYRVTPAGPLFTAAAAYASRDRLGTMSTNWPAYERLDLHGHALTLTWDIDERNQLKSISSRRTVRANDSVDLDFTPLTIATTNRISDFEQKSQELQWVGRTDHFDYVAGLYYYEDGGYLTSPHIYFFGTDSSQYGFGVEAKSAYGQLDWHATGALTLTAGVRRTEEDKTTSRYKTVTGAGAPIPRVSAEGSFAATTPLATVAYKVNDRLNVYAKYSEGFKSGGFQGEASTMAEAVIPFEPEKQKTFEIGAKFTSDDGRLQLNAAVFHNDIDNMQVSRFVPPGSSAIRNAGKATTKGVELEAVWVPTDALRLQGSYGYLDGKYDEFMEPAAAGQPITNVASNRSFPHAPESTLSLTIDMRLAQTAWGRLRALADYSYTSSFYAYAYQIVTVDPTRSTAGNSKVEGSGLLNLRLGLDDLPFSGPGRTDIALWVRNATDQQRPVNFMDFGPGFFSDYELAYFPEPRTYGATLRYRW
jgi:iron complex outermembrane receptor protein